MTGLARGDKVGGRGSRQQGVTREGPQMQHAHKAKMPGITRHDISGRLLGAG